MGSPFQVSYGDVVVGDDGAHILVREIDGPIPVAACWAPFRYTGPDLRTGLTRTVVVPILERAEVLPLPERVVEFVCKQGGELLLWDAAVGEMLNLPQAAHPDWVSELPPNTAVWVKFYEGRPVWMCMPEEQIPIADSPLAGASG